MANIVMEDLQSRVHMKKRNLWYVHPVEQNGKTAKYQFQMKASGNEKITLFFSKSYIL